LKKTLLVLLLFIFTLTGYADAASISPYSQGFVEGYLKQINPSTTAATTASLEIEDYSGNVYNFRTANAAYFTIDGLPAKLADFKSGMEVYAKLQGKSIISLEGYSTAQLGYISPRSKSRNGVIISIDRDQLQLQLSTGETKTFYTSPATLISRSGVSTTLSSLYVGDRVKCLFDAADTDIISQIMIEGNSILVKDVYQGTLKIADGIENTVVLGNIKALRNGQWTNYASSLKAYYNSEVPVYIGGQLISYQNLKYYAGKTVYMATREFFGREQIEKMVLKSQYEANYSEQITNINWYTDAMELSNNKNIAFNEGTIIVKNGRLVDKSALNTQMDALILADGRGDRAMADGRGSPGASAWTSRKESASGFRSGNGEVEDFSCGAEVPETECDEVPLPVDEPVPVPVKVPLPVEDFSNEPSRPSPEVERPLRLAIMAAWRRRRRLRLPLDCVRRSALER
jgi:hypothetical protein